MLLPLRECGSITRMTTPGTAGGVRARVREELTRQILDTARRHLATQGAAALSLRAVARELDMVSSAVYRYVPSRDELLTLLIVDAYNALGAAAERAESKVDRGDLTGRWLAVCTSVRRWALRHPHEYALIFGSPVPGYAAPTATIQPAARVGTLLIRVLSDGVGSGELPRDRPEVPEQVRRAIAPVRAAFPADIPDDLVVGGLLAWTHLIGAVSFELFGHRGGVVADAPALRTAFFLEEMTRVGRQSFLIPQ